MGRDLIEKKRVGNGQGHKRDARRKVKKSICSLVFQPGPVLYIKVESHKLHEPLLVIHTHKPLLQEKLQTFLIGSDDELAAQQVMPLFLDGEDNSHELPLVNGLEAAVGG